MGNMKVNRQDDKEEEAHRFNDNANDNKNGSDSLLKYSLNEL